MSFTPARTVESVIAAVIVLVITLPVTAAATATTPEPAISTLTARILPVRLIGESLVALSFYMSGLVSLFLIGRSFTAMIFYNMIFLCLAVCLVTKVSGSSVARPVTASPGVTSPQRVS